MAEKLYDVCARRNPNWEKRYEESIIKNFSDYGKGVTNLGMPKESCLVLVMRFSL